MGVFESEHGLLCVCVCVVGVDGEVVFRDNPKAHDKALTSFISYQVE